MSHLTRYTDYLTNVGGSITIARFDEDWEPIGAKVRAQLTEAGLTRESRGRIRCVLPPMELVWQDPDESDEEDFRDGCPNT